MAYCLKIYLISVQWNMYESNMPTKAMRSTLSCVWIFDIQRTQALLMNYSTCLGNAVILTFFDSTENSCQHDDVINWKHFLGNWPFCVRNSPVTVEFSTQRPVTRSFGVCFLWSAPWINGRVKNNRKASELRRHRARYDLIVMNDVTLHISS